MSLEREPRWQAVGLTAQEYQHVVDLLGREPNDLELGLFGVMWSEHCSYKSSRKLLKILPTHGARVLVGPGENAGVVDIGEGWAVALRIESHNHPSAVEPYQGAATGIGGIVRDIFTMGARPVALLDSLRFGLPDKPKNRWLLAGVVGGVGGYGNCLGVPTVGGETVFHPGYEGNPLVNVMCVGLLRKEHLVRGRADGPGNILLLVGARTGRDGIHGASLLASQSFTEQDEDQRPAVQVGDPFREKLLIEACLELIEGGLVVGVNDLGAAGITSAASETASRAGNGVVLELDRVPLREEGMTPYEIMLSESQERMLLIVQPEQAEAAETVCRRWGLDVAAVGQVTDDGFLRLRWRGQEVAAVPAHLLTEGAPAYERPWREPETTVAESYHPPLLTDPAALLKEFLASPHVASTAPIYRRYDYEVQTNTVLGPGGDAAVLRVRGTGKGLAVVTDGNGRVGELDPYYGGVVAVIEAARNLACVGAEPIGLSNCLNFGNPEQPTIMWQFRRALEGMRDACLALGVPVTGGNVSFYNESSGRNIPPTPVVGMVGLLDDVRQRTPSSPVAPGALHLLGGGDVRLDGSAWQLWREGRVFGRLPDFDLEQEAALQGLLRAAARRQLVVASHDVADGGLLVAACEMAWGSADLGLQLTLPPGDPLVQAFGEGGGRALVVTTTDEAAAALKALAAEAGVACQQVGALTADDTVQVMANGAIWLQASVETLATTWREGLAWAL